MTKTRSIAVVALAVLGLVAAGCDLPYAKAGDPCSPEGDFAQDGLYIMKCEGGRWVTGITVKQGDEFIEAWLGSPAPRPSPYYENCTAARNAGVTPLMRSDPGYAPHLDRDQDGIACE